jgi:hypothetical protein
MKTVSWGDEIPDIFDLLDVDHIRARESRIDMPKVKEKTSPVDPVLDPQRR